MSNVEMLMELDKQSFLFYVQTYIAKNPDVAAYVSDKVAAGIKDSLDDLKSHCADMEAVLATMANSKYKGSESFMLNILKKRQPRAFLNWEWLIEKLEKKVEHEK